MSCKGNFLKLSVYIKFNHGFVLEYHDSLLVDGIQGNNRSFVVGTCLVVGTELFSVSCICKGEGIRFVCLELRGRCKCPW